MQMDSLRKNIDPHDTQADVVLLVGKRKTVPLVVAEGVTVLDNSDHTIESGVEAALEILRQQELQTEQLEPPAPVGPRSVSLRVTETVFHSRRSMKFPRGSAVAETLRRIR